MPSLSNEAEEIHRMLSYLSRIPAGPGGSTSQSLASYFGVEPEGPDYFAFVAAIQLRFQRFSETLGATISNERHRGNVHAAIERVRAFSSYRYWQAGWHDTLRATLVQSDLDLIEGTGFGLGSIAPVVYLDSTERQSFIDELHRRLEEIDLSNDYLTDMIRVSLGTAIKMLDRFELFGSSIIGEKLIEAMALAKHAADEPAKKSTRSKFVALAATIGTVLSLIVLADDVPTAIGNHYTRFQSGTIFLPQPPAQKLLPSPEEFAIGGATDQD